MKRTGACVMFVVVLWATAMGVAGMAQTSVGQGLPETCGQCHALTVVCANLGQDAAFWRSTVSRMQQKGAALPSEQVAPRGPTISRA